MRGSGLFRGWLLSGCLALMGWCQMIDVGQMLILNGTGVLVVISPAGPKDPRWAKLNHESLDAHQLTLWKLSPRAPKARELRTAAGWSGQEGWLVLGPKERVLASGEGFPDGIQIATTLAQQGVDSRLDHLRKQRLAAPHRLDLRFEIIRECLSIAHTGTRHLLQERATPFESLNPFNTCLMQEYALIKLPEKAVKLSARDDPRIWGPYCREISQLLQQPGWPFLPWSELLRDQPLEIHSPSVLAAAPRWRKQVEAALRQHPDSYHLIIWWGRLAALTQAPARPLWDALPDVPGTWMRGFDPWNVLVGQAARHGEWPLVIEAMEGDLDGLLYALFRNDTAPADGHSRFVAWTHGAALYLEALLRVGRVAEADSLLRRLAAEPANGPYLSQAEGLAQRLGREDLALKWQEMRQQPPAALPLDTRNKPTLLLVLPKQQRRWFPGDVYDALYRHLVHFTVEAREIDAVLRREGWDPATPRWAILDGRGQVVATATTPPTTADLEARLLAAGARPRPDVWPGFLKQHPDHVLGHRQHLIQRRAEAEEALSRLSSPSGPGDLDATQERAVWGPWMDALEQALRHVDIAEVADAVINNILPHVENSRSPQVRALCRKVRLALEPLIQNVGDCPLLGRVWRDAVRQDPAPAIPFLVSLASEGWCHPRGNNAWFILTALKERLPREPAWREALDITEPCWQFNTSSEDGLLDAGAWEAWGALRFEALLRLDRPQDARDFLQAWMSQGGWPEARTEAEQIEKALNERAPREGGALVIRQ